MYTDASGIGWSRVLTQEETDDKGRTKSHPICYISGQFRGSQLNWAALMKGGIRYIYVYQEAYLLPHGRRNYNQM